MSNLIDSTKEFNDLWSSVLDLPTGTDVYSKLSIEDLLILKECISNINAP